MSDNAENERPIDRLGRLLAAAFDDANHPALLDWASIAFELKRLERELAAATERAEKAERELGDANERIAVLEQAAAEHVTHEVWLMEGKNAAVHAAMQHFAELEDRKISTTVSALAAATARAEKAERERDEARAALREMLAALRGRFDHYDNLRFPDWRKAAGLTEEGGR